MQLIRPLRAAVVLAITPAMALASSHMDAPLITLDDAANTTDVYAFVTKTGNQKYLTAALAVYPFEDPGIGPNRYNFDDNVIYTLQLSLGKDIAAGRTSISYWFKTLTRVKNKKTILQSFTGVVKNVDDAAQNLTQDYVCYFIDHRPGGLIKYLGMGMVPPNNQGIATPEYNLKAGEGVAKDGVGNSANLDRYTAQTIAKMRDGHITFCGQREDGFYGDINAIFDLLSLRSAGKDSQRGFNVHTITIQIPVEVLGGDMQMVAVHATTMRQQVKVNFDTSDPLSFGAFIQVGRQGNPLFCEALVAIADKNQYNRSSPQHDALLFKKYATDPELAALLNAIVFKGNPIPGIEKNRTDLEGIFIPDLIKVDLSTNAVRLAGGGPNHLTNPDDQGFSRLSVFGGDTIFSPLQKKMIAGGWPNGRRYGDDVIDIAVSAVISDLRVNPPVIRVAGDNVDGNDAVYNKVMPYAGTPLNGRNHKHD